MIHVRAGRVLGVSHFCVQTCEEGGHMCGVELIVIIAKFV